MKKCISRLLNLMPILCTMCLMSASCKSVSSVQEFRSSGVQEFSVARSVDTIYRHDSVYVREVQRGDTVYLTRTEWRDRWRTRVERDTVVDVRVEKEVVQLPPERHVPKFYRWCTIALWAIGILALGYGLLRWRVKWLRVGSG